MKNAGFDIVETISRHRSDCTTGIALGHRETRFGHEWVTWEWTEWPGQERSYYWGHYFTDPEAAREDYWKRTNKL